MDSWGDSMSNRDKVIAAAEEAGIYRLYDGISYGPSGLSSEQFERFYAIAFEAGRQAEREEIVKDLLPPIATPQTKAHYIANEIAEALCKAIRARGESK